MPYRKEFIMLKKLKIVFLVAPLIYVLDQYTKWLIVKNIAYGSKIVVLNNFFDIVHVRNTGAAFGMFADSNPMFREPFFYIISVLAIIFLFYFLIQIPDHHQGLPVGIGLIFGGALGNISDRIVRGSVVDFLSFHWYTRSIDLSFFGKGFHVDLSWPSFNVADSAITVGVFWLLVLMSHHERKKEKIKK